MGDNKIHVDYLMHRNVNTRHKYIAKIGEGINARYFYTEEALNAYKKDLANQDEATKKVTVKNVTDPFQVRDEIDRSADRAKYEAKKHAINAEATLRVKNAERKYGTDSVQSYAELGKGLAKMGANELLRALNEQGSGRADDAIVNTVKKGKKTLNRILRKR